MKEKETGIIYQYYDLKTFDSILKNRELWFSDIKKMNDTNEDKELFIFLKKELKKTLEEISEEEKKQKDYQDREDYLKKIEEITTEERFRKYFIEIKKISIRKDTNLLTNLKKKRNKITALLLMKNFQNLGKFISCFSKKGDLLGQWRSYADDGKGIAIGYNLEELEKILKSLLNNENHESKVAISEINYLDSKNIKIEKIFELFDKDNLKVLSQLVEDLTNSINSHDKLEREFFPNLLDRDLFQWIINFSGEFTKNDIDIWNYMKKKYSDKNEISTFFKHFGFSEESEVRILIKKKRSFEQNVEKNKSFISENNFRISTKNNDFIEYIKLVMNELDFKKVISEIVIGPNNNINKDYMNNILTKYGFDTKNIKIKKSTIPYKN